MPVRLIIAIHLLIFFNNVTCELGSSSQGQKNITLDECLLMLDENNISSVMGSPSKPTASICETVGCVKAAAQILDYMDENQNPCDNFYQFVSGHFIEETTAKTESYESRSFYSTATDSAKEKVGLLLLSEPVQPFRFEWKPFRLAKNFYESCVNHDVFEFGNQELIEKMYALDGWPAVKGRSSWLSREFDLARSMRKLKEFGFGTDSIFNVNVGLHSKNTTNRFLYIQEGSYETFKDISREDLAEHHREEVENVLKFQEMLIEISSPKAAATEDPVKASDEDDNHSIKELQELYLNLLNDFNAILPLVLNVTENEPVVNPQFPANDDEERGVEYEATTEAPVETFDVNHDSDDYAYDHNYNIRSIKELQELYPYLNWLDYFNAILPSGLNVTENELVADMNPQFFEKLAAVINATFNRTISNYVVWRAVHDEYKMQLQILGTGKDRRGKCINLTSKKFAVPVGLLYSRKHFNEKSRQEVIKLVEDVRHAFIDTLADVTWMDVVTRKTVIAKAESIIAHVGYANEFYENGELDEYYAHLDMDPDAFIVNLWRLTTFNTDHSFNELRQPFNRSTWKELLKLDPIDANAFYSSITNAMQLSVAILHELFFSVNRPQYINYARLGRSIGHEIIHGFDDVGRKFDLNGNLNQWWDADTKRKFRKETSCMVDQYSNYTDQTTKLAVNGAATKNDNIADNGGVRVAYHAYLNWIKRNGDEDLLPALPYNQKQ